MKWWEWALLVVPCLGAGSCLFGEAGVGFLSIFAPSFQREVRRLDEEYGRWCLVVLFIVAFLAWRHL